SAGSRFAVTTLRAQRRFSRPRARSLPRSVRALARPMSFKHSARLRFDATTLKARRHFSRTHGVRHGYLRHLAAVIEPQPEVSKMTIDAGLKPEGAPERSPIAGAGAPSGVD